MFGGGCLIGLVAAISFPLVLFALGNTVGEPNLPESMTLNVKLGSNQPIYTMTIEGTVEKLVLKNLFFLSLLIICFQV